MQNVTITDVVREVRQPIVLEMPTEEVIVTEITTVETMNVEIPKPKVR
jgi:hypothetical protein